MHRIDKRVLVPTDTATRGCPRLSDRTGGRLICYPPEQYVQELLRPVHTCAILCQPEWRCALPHHQEQSRLQAQGC